ncbi:MAG: AraC family transcriptional regulator [Bacteriovoracaceae bacterium]|nr:AraC family transcriptional regulator [Bacteriovoracaceae bacterium]
MLPVLYLWSSKAMYLGASFNTGEHSHNAIQVVIALDGETEIQIEGEWRKDSVFVLLPNTKHRTTFLGRVALLYVDAEDSRFHFTPNSPNAFVSSETLNRLNSCCNSPVSLGDAEILYNSVLTDLGIYAFSSGPQDPRIRKCLKYIESQIGNEINMEDICKKAGLSESTFSHLFSKEVGIPLRRLLIWKRLKIAINYFLQNGCTLTEASLQAGFSDQSHFTKSFREIFGITPSFVFGKKLRLLNSMKRVKV